MLVLILTIHTHSLGYLVWISLVSTDIIESVQLHCIAFATKKISFPSHVDTRFVIFMNVESREQQLNNVKIVLFPLFELFFSVKSLRGCITNRTNATIVGDLSVHLNVNLSDSIEGWLLKRTVEREG